MINKLLETILSNVKKKAAIPSNLGGFVANLIKKRTRLGGGVTNGERGGRKYSLRTIARTPQYERFRKTHKKEMKETAPAKHNLTFTGQLLNSIRHKTYSKHVEISLSDSRSDSVSNNDIRKWQAERGRHFFELTSAEMKQTTKFVKLYIERRLRSR